jgi:hypothetical protein
MHWLSHWLGLDNVAGPIYAFFSGSGSVFLPPVLSVLGVAAVFWWHHQCHVHHCYRYARRLTAANERACGKHHPEPKRTVHDIHRAHHAAKARSNPG